MSPRTGRPPLENPRNSRVEIRMTSEEEKKLDYCCKATGKSRSDIAREGIDIVYSRLRGPEKK